MIKPLFILHIITSTRRGGAETQLLGLLRASDPNELQHSVISLEPLGDMAPLMSDAGAEVQSLELKPGLGALVLGVSRLKKRIKAFRPDVIQTWMYHADLLGILAAGDQAPVVWSLRCSDLNLGHLSPATRLVVRACAALSRRPAAICANSFCGLDWHAGLGYPPEAMQTICNGFDLDRFRPDPGVREQMRTELGLAPDDLAVGHIASFQPVKDHVGFLKACQQAAEAEPRARLVLIGEGVTGDNPALAPCVEPPLKGRCLLLGPRDDVERILPALDLVVSSSLSEGFPNVVGEAMACALPVAATEVGDTAALLAEGGRLVPPGDPSALAKAMLEILAMPPEQRAALGRANRERLAQGFSLESLYAAHLALYRKLVT